MEGLIARLLPEIGQAPPPAAAGAPDFDGNWFRPVQRAKPPAAPAPVAVPDVTMAPVSEIVTAGPGGPGFAPVGLAPTPARPAEDRAALIAAAEARGYEAGRAEALAEAEERLAEERAAFETRLADARRAWAETEGTVLAGQLAAAFAGLDATLSERVARLLAPVLNQALRRQAVEALSGAVTRLLAEPQPAAISITGPEDLIAALSGRLSGLSAAVAFTAADVTEVTVSAGETVIETELSAWGRLIADAVAGA
ncbi:hypothetical protein ASG52_05595 [Methylobacterium sp. Leaf456]|uniref:hypothetical protein n=1 Tax=Methylobacterium sp. Leaf456 TaxID=1736382 RepID=UPI0006F628B9|nr:hypothetical protein [Methylobacterium sp. Leaf456]KQT53587.1 hypothetical protein ASG52_05595 [Methylobacterium sp. Leaf456]